VKRRISTDLMVPLAITVGIVAIVAAVFFDWIPASAIQSNIEMSPDGDLIYKVTIDEHIYLKTGNVLTHSASCPNPSHPQNQ